MGKGQIAGAGKQDGDIDEIAATFRRWQVQNGEYKDVKGFCKSLDRKTIKRNRFNLTPEKYV